MDKKQTPAKEVNVDAAIAHLVLTAEIDELGDLERRVAAYKPDLDRYEMLKRSIRLKAFAPPDQCQEIRGDRYIAVLGPCASQTAIDIPKLLRIIKPAAFVKFATCTLAALSGNVTDGVYETVTSMARTGPRSIRTFERLGDPVQQELSRAQRPRRHDVGKPAEQEAA